MKTKEQILRIINLLEKLYVESYGTEYLIYRAKIETLKWVLEDNYQLE